MMQPIDDILAILAACGVEIGDDAAEAASPEIGQVQEDETIYTTSIGAVLGDDDADELPPDEASMADDDRLESIKGMLESIIGPIASNGLPRSGQSEREQPPEPHCAWYCPIQFYGHGWGIYIREECVIDIAFDIARNVDWRRVVDPTARIDDILKQLLRGAFYTLFLHEQFHHKVESLGLRLLIASGSDRYRPYKANVYRPGWGTPDCLEESLANADSFRRLSEPRYTKRIERPIMEGLRRYLVSSFATQPPGYREALNFLRESEYRAGLYELQSRVLDGIVPVTTAPAHWAVAPDVITSLKDISQEIYVVMPIGARPLFTSTWLDPGATASSRQIAAALIGHYGYRTAPGKGSHIKLSKPNAPTIIIPGNEAVLSPGVTKHVLNAIGGYPLSRLPDLVKGDLPMLPVSHK